MRSWVRLPSTPVPSLLQAAANKQPAAMLLHPPHAWTCPVPLVGATYTHFI